MRLRKRCKHENVRCIHGDEINHYSKGYFRPKFARVFCEDCLNPLYNRPLLDICSVNNQPHRSRQRQKWSWAH